MNTSARRVLIVRDDDTPLLVEKREDDVIDVTLDYSRYLANGDSIVTSSWETDGGPVAIADTPAASIADNDHDVTVWLSGGSANSCTTFTNRVTTTAGRSYSAEVLVDVPC